MYAGKRLVLAALLLVGREALAQSGAQPGIAAENFTIYNGVLRIPVGRTERLYATGDMAAINSTLLAPGGRLKWKVSDTSIAVFVGQYGQPEADPSGGRVTLHGKRDGKVTVSYALPSPGASLEVIVGVLPVMAEYQPGAQPAAGALNAAGRVAAARPVGRVAAGVPSKWESFQVVRLCKVYNSGALYCRNVTDLLQNEFKGTSATDLQAALAGIYLANNLDQRLNGLMDCGSKTWASAPQSPGSMPTGADVQGALDACLSQLGGKMPGSGVGGALGGPSGGSITVGGQRPGGGGSGCSSGGANRFVGIGPASLVSGRTASETAQQVEQQRMPWQSYKDLAREYRDAAASADKDAAAAATAEERQNAKMIAASLRELQAQAEKRAKEEQANQGARGAGGNVDNVDPEGDVCGEVSAAVVDLMRECTRNGWSSYECMKMKSCGDPALIQPMQTEKEGTGYICGEVEIFGAEDNLTKALIMACEARTKPGPDGSTGCATPAVGRLSVPAQRVSDICNNPLALVTQDCFTPSGSQQASQTFTRSVEAASKEACAKVGGPICTLTSGGVKPPGGPIGPKNRTAGQLQSAPRRP